MTDALLPVKVLAVDDQPVFLRAARSLIAATPGFEQVGQATSGPEALKLAAALMPDLVLLDLRMPGMDGAETARRLHQSNPDTIVVLISMGEVPPSAAASSGVTTHLRKQSMSPRALARTWAVHGHQTSA